MPKIEKKAIAKVLNFFMIPIKFSLNFFAVRIFLKVVIKVPTNPVELFKLNYTLTPIKLFLVHSFKKNTAYSDKS